MVPDARQEGDPLESYEESVAALAYEVLSQESGLWGRILYSLLGRPRRFSELEPQLEEASPNNLTYALKKFRRKGLIDRRKDLVDDEVVPIYQITPQGIDVYFQARMIETLIEATHRVTALEGERAGIDTDLGEGIFVSGEISRSGTYHQIGGQSLFSSLGEPWPIHVEGVDAADLVVDTGPEGRRVYHVYQVEGNRWKVQREGAKKATRVLEDYHDAIGEAISRAGDLGQVVIHSIDGSVQLVINLSKEPKLKVE